MTVLHINRWPGPVKEIRRDDAGLKWCFRCRKRLPHEHVLRRYDCDPMDDYYGPWWSLECPHCHSDCTYFPGCGPE